jgi:hypothetical protein
MSPNVVSVGGILLDVDNGSSFRVTEDLPGWDDAPAVRSGLITKAQQDGDWDATGFSDGRVVTITGTVAEATPQAAYAVLQQLAALRPQQVVEFIVANSSIGTLSAMTRVTVGVKPVWIGDTAFEYTMTVTAPDPLKYGPPTYGYATLSTSTPGAGRIWPRAWPTDWGIPAGVTPGAVAVANAGTAPYWPRLRIDGPSPNPTVSMVETGAWVRYGGTLLAGQYLDFDMANRRVLLQGQVSVRQLVSSSGDWLAVPVGGGSVAWTDDGGDPAAKLSVWGYEGSYS